MQALFALLFALANAQQFSQFAPPYGQAVFGAGSPSNSNLAQQEQGRQGQPDAIQPPSSSIPTAFDIEQQSLKVIAAGHQVRGSSLVYNLPQFGLGALASYNKAWAQNVNLRRIRRAQDQVSQTSNDENKMDDLRLEHQAAKSQYRRRVSQLFAGSTPLPAIFEGRAHQALVDLAKNQRDDAIAAIQQNPSAENFAKLRSARSTINEEEESRTANALDIIGAGNSLGAIAPLKRISASEIALRSARRDHKSLVDAYNQNPSEDNWWNLRLSKIKLRALNKDIDANHGEATIKLASSGPLSGVSQYYMSQRFLQEDRLWQKYQRLALDNLNRQRGQGGASPDLATPRMLALTGYGSTGARI